MTTPLRIGIVGFGKIARDEHAPAIAKSDRATLIAIADPALPPCDVPCYSDLPAMIAAHPDIDTVVMCQPPQFRFAAAEAALLAGKHVFLEKPPGVSCAEVERLAEIADQMGVTLFTGWHCQWHRHVAALRNWCAAHPPRRIEIRWLEDVRVWHPGQDWIWQPNGFGVFDPGMNALSIVTHILAQPVSVTAATVETPSNRETPIAAQLAFKTQSGTDIEAQFDFRQTGPQTWEIEVHADAGRYHFPQDGEALESAAAAETSAIADEYEAMYARFFDLVAARQSEVDLAPLRLVEEALAVARQLRVEPFHD